MKLICFDIGATDLKYGVIESGKIIYKAKTATSAWEGQGAFEQKLCRLTKELLTSHQIDGIGISCAGSVNYDTGVLVIPSDSAKAMGNINFKQLFKDNFNLPCSADNDVNCFAMAENCAGYGKIFDNFVVMTIGSGIGGGIVFNDTLWRGLDFNGGEIGRILVKNGHKYEATASVNALLRMCQEKGLNYKNALEVFNDYDQGDEKIIPLVKTFFENVAYGLANIIYILNPESVIIGGGISNRASLADEIKLALKEILHPDFYKTVDLRNAYFKNDGGLIGSYYNFTRDYKGEKQKDE